VLTERPVAGTPWKGPWCVPVSAKCAAIQGGSITSWRSSQW
jgi:hypothetical protein